MRRQQVSLDGTVDASPIYLHGVTVNGAAHDVFFVTTTYGKTIAIDANDGSILWEFTPAELLIVGRFLSHHDGDARRRSRTVARVYAASPDGKIQKLAVADGPRAVEHRDHAAADAREDRVRAESLARPRHRGHRRLYR
jgi:glucose dehydrogenase